MVEFAKNNVCGQNLLQIVAVGNTIIAEMFRLKDRIPQIYRLDAVLLKKSKQSQLIYDFSYFEKSEDIKKLIENNLELKEADEKFVQIYYQLLKRFYLVFESIYQYAISLNNFINELYDGVYLQHTLESVFQNGEGKQLLCESLYLYGVMLLVVDFYIPHVVRERLIVSYLRYSNTENSEVEDVCKLLRSTYQNDMYPGNFFRRIPFDETFIEMVIGRLRSDDIYNQMPVYSSPEHGSTALASQAGMLYVCLFFQPNYLDKDYALMRGVVDKFFPDNWIVPIYMGITINLLDSWSSHPSALDALKNTLKPSHILEISQKHYETMQQCLTKHRDVFFEDNINKIMHTLREWNVSYRWIMLHTMPAIITFTLNDYHNDLYRQINSKMFKNDDIVEMLLYISRLENKVRDNISQMLVNKEKRWITLKQETIERIVELSKIFSGEKIMQKIKSNEHLRKWFKDISKEIEQLNFNNRIVAERNIIQLQKVLEEVEEFHNLDVNLQVKQHLFESRQYLEEMITIVKINEDVLIQIQLIGDFSYAFININNYTDIMQNWLIDSTKSTTFPFQELILKFSSALEIPLLRINQAQSDDLISVSHYYSHKLVRFIRNFVQIIPKYIFDSIVVYFKETNKPKKDLEERRKISTLTLKISSLVDNILSMNITMVGVIVLDPKQLLEECIRKELDYHLLNVLRTQTKFLTLSEALTYVTRAINKYRFSLEYIEDFLHLNGLKIFKEELSRNIDKCVIEEYLSIQNCTKRNNMFKNDKISINVIGIFALKMLSLIEGANFIELKNEFTKGVNKKPLNIKVFSDFDTEIGPEFLIGLSKIYGFLIQANLHNFFKLYKTNILENNKKKKKIDFLEQQELIGINLYQIDSNKFYETLLKISENTLNDGSENCIENIGKMQILRKEISLELNKICQFYSTNLEIALRTFNKSILLQIKVNQLDTINYITPNNKLLIGLNKYVNCAGMYNPHHTIFLTTIDTNKMPQYGFVIFMFIIRHIEKINFNYNLTINLQTEVPGQIDEQTFNLFISTMLQQCHRDLTKTIIEYFVQYVCIYLNVDLKSTINKPIKNAFSFLKIIIKPLQLDAIVDLHILKAIKEQFKYLNYHYSYSDF